MATKKKRKPNAAFMKPVQPDAALAPVVGSKPIPRTEVTKKLWAYIKKNGLQDKKKKTNINADDNLKVVFGGKKQVTMFEMTKLVSKHLK
jgi:chromatin remodeling complex protein RSC6